LFVTNNWKILQCNQELAIATNILQINENCIYFSTTKYTINIDFSKFVQQSREKKTFIVVFLWGIHFSG